MTRFFSTRYTSSATTTSYIGGAAYDLSGQALLRRGAIMLTAVGTADACAELDSVPGRSMTPGTETAEDYTGHELDAEANSFAGQTGMHYAGARYYMSALGRWTSTDPLLNGSPAGLVKDGRLHYLSASPYNYVFNNPTGLVDPTGRAASCPECDDPLIGVRAIATAVYDVKHSAQNLILNSPVGRYFKPTEAGMRWQSGYATDAQGDQIFETEIKQVPEGGALQETVNLALDALVVAGGNPLAGGAGGLLARSGLKGQPARSAAKNLKDLPADAFTHGDADLAFKRLERFQKVDPNVASDRLHTINDANNLGGADNVIFDATSGVFHPETGEYPGTLTQSQ